MYHDPNVQEIWRCIQWHDDVIKWKHFPRYWPFVRGIHRSPVNSPHKGQWRGALVFSLIYTWTNGWVNNRDAGDLRRHWAHYDVTLMKGQWRGALRFSLICAWTNGCVKNRDAGDLRHHGDVTVMKRFISHKMPIYNGRNISSVQILWYFGRFEWRYLDRIIWSVKTYSRSSMVWEPVEKYVWLYIVRPLSADALALPGARTSTGTVMFISHIYGTCTWRMPFNGCASVSVWSE